MQYPQRLVTTYSFEYHWILHLSWIRMPQSQQNEYAPSFGSAHGTLQMGQASSDSLTLTIFPSCKKCYRKQTENPQHEPEYGPSILYAQLATIGPVQLSIDGLGAQ